MFIVVLSHTSSLQSTILPHWNTSGVSEHAVHGDRIRGSLEWTTPQLRTKRPSLFEKSSQFGAFGQKKPRKRQQNNTQPMKARYQFDYLSPISTNPSWDGRSRGNSTVISHPAFSWYVRCRSRSCFWLNVECSVIWRVSCRVHLSHLASSTSCTPPFASCIRCKN